MLDRDDAEAWISQFAHPTGRIEVARQRPWAAVLRVPLAGGAAWFKACGRAQAFEPRLSAEPFVRWPDRVGEVLAYDGSRGWLLLKDAGTALGELGNRPEAWLEVLPRYSELQRGEAEYADDHIAHDVPALALPDLPGRYDDLHMGSVYKRGDCLRVLDWGRQLDLAPVLLARGDLLLSRRTHGA
jgi:hypothetical protein